MVKYHDPIKLALKAFDSVYGDVKCTVTYDNFSEHKDKKPLGVTEVYGDGAVLRILLNHELKMCDIVGILIHELAHAATNGKGGHGPIFKKAFNKIGNKYDELGNKLVKSGKYKQF